MERDGVAHRVPVRYWSEPWNEGSPLPRQIDFDRAHYNVVIVLYDGVMAAAKVKPLWEQYVNEIHAKIASRGKRDLYMVFGDPSGNVGLAPDLQMNIQYARRDLWKTKISISGLETHMLLHVVFTIRDHLKKALDLPEEEDLFVSHAKLDGDETTSAIVNYVNSLNNDVPLRTFYDAKALSPGDNFANEFGNAIRKGTLLAIVSDTYDSRLWCVHELTEAKRARRPIVLADIGKVRISRTYPYGANVPRVRVNPLDSETAWIEALLVECLSEGLRCDLFKLEVASRLGTTDERVMILPRPPELFDIIDAPSRPETIIYPDPPLPAIEATLIAKCLGLGSTSTATIKTLSEIS
ncbi:toll/interleukin-1 receptor domain-containing protein [Sinorhizobium meliloti]|uniref:toll/interleukin-1 receptor domain-containing protein n=1 Tax=Rhizobium meliloti TaxID=382 RepID=UPI00299E615E